MCDSSKELHGFTDHKSEEKINPDIQMKRAKRFIHMTNDYTKGKMNAYTSYK